MNENNNVLIIKTVQIQPIRNMITAIKDVLTDATITYTSNGLKIINFDKTHTILVNVILHAEKFELYDCTPEKIIVCANTMHLFKVISTMSNDDTLSMYIDKDDYHDGIVSHLGLQYDNGDIKQCYSQKLRLITAGYPIQISGRGLGCRSIAESVVAKIWSGDAPPGRQLPRQRIDFRIKSEIPQKHGPCFEGI